MLAWEYTLAAVHRIFCKIPRTTPLLESLFNKVAGLQPEALLKKRLQHRYFLENFAKFLRAYFLWGSSERTYILQKTAVFGLLNTVIVWGDL